MNVVSRWLRRRRRGAAESVADTYADLRASLPAEYRNWPDVEIPGLWGAWAAARAGHTADTLIRNHHVQPVTADCLVTLAHTEPNVQAPRRETITAVDPSDVSDRQNVVQLQGKRRRYE